MRVMVTGGVGFIGSAVCRLLVGENGLTVLNVDKLTYAANLASLADLAGHQRYNFLKADVCDRAAMDGVFAKFRPDSVVHLAAESHVDRSIVGSDAFVQTNIFGTYTLLEAARAYWSRLPEREQDTFRFIHVSTDEVYGSLGPEGLFSETTAYDPSSPYSATKAASDHLAMAWHRTYGMPIIISNCSNNYGPYQFPEKLIPLMILNARAGRELPVYGDGLNIRDWLYVEDHARALQLILERGQPGETYNVGGGNERTNLEVVNQICRLMDQIRPDGAPHDRLITFVKDRPGHDRRYAIDASKLQKQLGWGPRESFESGLEKTVRWYLENEAWWGPLQRKIYNGERLGLIDSGGLSTIKASV